MKNPLEFYCIDKPFHNCKKTDMIFIDKEHHEYHITDFGIPYHTRVDDKEVEKIEKYFDLARELKKVWNMKVTVVLLVAGALGTPAKALDKRLKTTGMKAKNAGLQKIVLIHTGRILRKVLEV